MEKQGEKPMENPNPGQKPLCDECKEKTAEYKCPGCSIRSCSLPCVKAHKKRLGCTGKRQTTQFVPISQFDDNQLLSDYNLLEDVKRVVESAQRMKVKLSGHSHFYLPFPLKSLRSAAASRKTKLLFLPSGMSKRVKNQSFYNNRKKFISWTIEWRFNLTDVVLMEHGIHENMNLSSVIEKHLEPGPWNHPLKEFCDEPLEHLKIFIRVYPKGHRSPFRELDIKSPIREQLANLVILEYPVIHVFLPSHSYNFEVIKKAKLEVKESITNNQPSPKGVSFREEEIQDSGPSDPQVLDLLIHNKQDSVFPTTHRTTGTEKMPNDTLESPWSAIEAECSNPASKDDIWFGKAEDDNRHSNTKTNERAVIGMDFDFEQGLIDAYSHLISETNPDDFLDLEALLNEGVELGETRDQIDFSEELEEGEIPEY